MTTNTPDSSDDEFIDQDDLDLVDVAVTTTTRTTTTPSVDDADKVLLDRLTSMLRNVAALSATATEYLCSSLTSIDDYKWILVSGLKDHLQKEAKHWTKQPCVITPRGIETLLAFREWLDYCLIRNQTIEVQLFTKDVAKAWCQENPSLVVIFPR